MTGIAQQLSETDIAAVAAYYANLANAKAPDAVPAKALQPKNRP
jgi:cytochrome c553